MFPTRKKSQSIRLININVIGQGMPSKTTVAEAMRLDHRGELTNRTKGHRISASAQSFFTYASKPRLLGGDSR
jgi:hypothetical protein